MIMVLFPKRLRSLAPPCLLAAVIMAGLLPVPALAGKNVCSGRQVFLEDITVRQRAGINSEEIRSAYVPALHEALSKKGFILADGPVSAADGSFAMKVRVRAWVSKTGSGRRVLELAANVRVDQEQDEVWDGEVNPGNVSRLLHGKHSSPENLAKRTAEMVVDACVAGWMEEQ